MTDVPDRRPWVDARSLRVGVTGHRAIPAEARAALRSRLARHLRAVADAARALPPPASGGGGPRLAFLTALASGTDQLAAEEALEHGYEIQCPLPFDAEVYRRDFEEDPDADAAFERLLPKATAVFELDGDGSTTESRAAGYEGVGRTLVEQSDLLIAVWDGEPARGQGGTAEVVKTALAAGLAVLVLDPTDAARDSLRIGATVAGLEGDSPLSGVVSALASRSASALNRSPSENAGLRREDAYATFLLEKAPRRRLAWRLYVGRWLSGLWPSFLRLFGKTPQTRGPSTPLEANGRNPEGPGSPRALHAFFERHYRWVNELSRFYRGLYRSAVCLNLLLGAFAVFFAVLGSGHFFPKAAIVELALLLSILLIHVLSTRLLWHEKSIQYRVLAEQLRPMPYLSLVGASIPFTRPPAHLGREFGIENTWMSDYFRAIVRSASLPDARCTPAWRRALAGHLGEGWIADQERYHRMTALRARRARNAIDASSYVFLGLAFFGVLLHFALPQVSEWPLIFTAAGPAFAGALHGIASYASLHRVQQRSGAMARRLAELGGQLEEMDREAPRLLRLQRFARVAATDMLQETGDWRALYRTGEVPV